MTKENTEKLEMRLMLVLERMATNTDHNPGEVIMHDGPETFAVRDLTEQEIEDRSRAIGLAQAPAPAPEPGTDDAFKIAARETVIVTALHRLDHSDPSSWTDSGQPSISAVSLALVNQGAAVTETSRAEIRKFAPNFKRVLPVATDGE